MQLKGIDVSHHQGIINWDKVKNQIDFAILSVGYGDNISSQDDQQFHRNAKECTRLNIPFGVYIYSYATSLKQAKSEADHVLRMIKGYKLDYPVYYDLEDASTTGKCNNYLISTMANLFCTTIEEHGYWCGVYANTSWFNTKLTDKVFSKWTKWVAQYNSKCEYKGGHDIWQYASDGRITGINGNVDVNYCYRDFPNVINGVKTSIDIVTEYVEYGTARVQVDKLNVRDTPSLSGNLVASYSKGETFKYDYVIVKKDFTWVRYLSYTGDTRYVAVRETRGNIYAFYD